MTLTCKINNQTVKLYRNRYGDLMISSDLFCESPEADFNALTFKASQKLQELLMEVKWNYLKLEAQE